MKALAKKDFPVSQVRKYLEPGPIVLLSAQWKQERNVMTLGWQTPMEFSPSLIGCIVANTNHSFDLIRKSRECVINIPEIELAEKVVKIGNCSGREVDKFSEFQLSAMPAKKVHAPLIKECFANFECKLYDTRLIKKYNFFIFKVLKAHVARKPEFPQTIHYRGDGKFMLSGRSVSYRRWFKKENL